ncbi:MAG: hypothetical protein JW751_24960 [Polyangiaceae bacterium]|nr:hypothetical protein [Polyangiaceae bacterium]
MGLTTFDRRLGGFLAGRYRIDEVRPGDSVDSSFVATHLDSGRRVLLVEMKEELAAGWERVLETAHPHLATPFEVLLIGAGRAVIVLEAPGGPDLERVLAGGCPLDATIAVDLALALASALASLHEKGTVHGLVRPSAVVMAEARGPVLGAAPAAPNPDPYRAPESAGGSAAMGDDLWAIAAILHRAATGAVPPTAGYPGPEDSGLHQSLPTPLADWLATALGPGPRRPATAADLVDSLEACRRRLIGDTTPPLDPAELPTSGGALWRRGGAVVLFGIIAGGVAAWVAYGGAAPMAPPAPVLTSASPVSPSSPGPVASVVPARSASGETPRPAVSEAGDAGRVGQGGAGPEEDGGTSAESIPVEEDLETCVQRQFPEGSFRKSVDLEPLCTTTDPRRGAWLLRIAVVKAGGRGAATPAMDIWSRMGPYGMAGFSVVRAACCPSAAPIQLPVLRGCPPLTPIVEDLGRASVKAEPIEPVLERYAQNLRCQFAHGNGYAFELRRPPDELQEAAFHRLLEARRVR